MISVRQCLTLLSVPHRLYPNDNYSSNYRRFMRRIFAKLCKVDRGLKLTDGCMTIVELFYQPYTHTGQILLTRALT